MDIKAAADPSPGARDIARRKANTLFSAHDERTALVKDMMAKERAANDAKTARLRALRLAREAAMPVAATGAEKPARKRSRRKVVRIGH